MRHCRIFAMILWLLPLSVAAELLQPEIGLGWTNGWVREWRRDVPGLRVSDSCEKVSGNLTKVVRRWTWTGIKPLERVTLSVRYRMDGDGSGVRVRSGA